MNTRRRKNRIGKPKTRRTAIKFEKLGDRVLMAADVMNDLIDSKETPAEISTQTPAKSQSADSTKDDASAKGNSSSTKAPVTKSSEPIWVNLKAESLGEADKATEGDDGAKEMSKSEWSAPKARNVEPMLQTKEQLLFEGESIEVQQEIEDHLAHSKLEEIEGLEKMESSLLDDLMAERSAETERYGKIERESLMSEHSNPNQVVRDFGADPFQSPLNDVSENDIRGASGEGMASDPGSLGETKSTFYQFLDAVGNAKIPGFSTAAKITNTVHDGLISRSTSTEREKQDAYNANSFKTNPQGEVDFTPFIASGEGESPKRYRAKGWCFRPDRPAPDGTGSGTSLPTQLVREAMVKLNAQYRQQPWLGSSGQPVPDSDGGTPLDFHSAAQVFGQLGRQNWNPMIVQPGPEGDMESNQAGAKEAPRNVGAMKMAMAGQPNPEDPDWGTSDGGKGGPSGAVTFNPQPVATQRAVGGAEHGLKVEQQED